jgi:hypothetical protein
LCRRGPTHRRRAAEATGAQRSTRSGDASARHRGCCSRRTKNLRSLTFAALIASSLASGACVFTPADADVDPTPAPVSSAAPASAARVRAVAALELVDEVGLALELLGLVPDTTCGAPVPTRVAQAAAALQTRYTCATHTVTTRADHSVALTWTFAPGGCVVDGARLGGSAVVSFAVGHQLTRTTVDARTLTLDGRAVGLALSDEQCADVRRVRVVGQGALAGGGRYELDVTVTRVSGSWLTGSVVVLDGSASATRSDGQTDGVAFAGLTLTVGDPLPQSGSLILQRAGSPRVGVAFERRSPIHRTATITLEGRGGVAVALLG